ncbi:MAG: hypothetical protein NT118_15775 [Lentisphaerae bacterium]|nr:hypothetical protein [Lentisphaerota bacterium]
MNKHKLFLIGGMMALFIVFGVLALRSSKPTAMHPASSRDVRTGVKGADQLKAGIKRVPAVKGSEEFGSGKEPLAGSVPVTGEKTPRMKAVEAWEKQIDDVIARTNVPLEDHAKRVKEVFDKLDREDQVDGIHHGLNLLPDERFPTLYAILYDKSEDPEVLDAIFSDALNRPEEIKLPLMKALRKDREHPMFFESARILDVIESAEATP